VDIVCCVRVVRRIARGFVVENGGRVAEAN